MKVKKVEKTLKNILLDILCIRRWIIQRGESTYNHKSAMHFWFLGNKIRRVMDQKEAEILLKYNKIKKEYI